MRFTATTIPTALIGLLSVGAQAQECSCSHNSDAGRWRDPMSPAQRVKDLCVEGGACHQAEKGYMCVLGDTSQCLCAEQAAKDWQSWHGDWFLWSSVTCGDLAVTINTGP